MPNSFVICDIYNNNQIELTSTESIKTLTSIVDELFYDVFKSPYTNNNIMNNECYNLLLCTIFKNECLQYIVKFFALIEKGILKLFLLEQNKGTNTIVYLHVIKKDCYKDCIINKWSFKTMNI